MSGRTERHTLLFGFGHDRLSHTRCGQLSMRAQFTITPPPEPKLRFLHGPTRLADGLGPRTTLPGSRRNSPPGLGPPLQGSHPTLGLGIGGASTTCSIMTLSSQKVFPDFCGDQCTSVPSGASDSGWSKIGDPSTSSAAKSMPWLS